MLGNKADYMEGRVLLETLRVAQLVRELATFYETQRFIPRSQKTAAGNLHLNYDLY